MQHKESQPGGGGVKFRVSAVAQLPSRGMVSLRSRNLPSLEMIFRGVLLYNYTSLPRHTALNQNGSARNTPPQQNSTAHTPPSFKSQSVSF